MKDKQGILFIIVGALGLIISFYFLVLTLFERPTTNLPDIDGQEVQQDVFTGSDTQDQEPQDIINILMPSFFVNSGFEKFISDTEHELSIDIDLHYVARPTEYNELGSGRDFQEEIMDIILLPIDFLSKFEGNAIMLELAESITGFYHPAFDIYMDRGFTFIPHVFDPLLIFSQNGLRDPSDLNTFSLVMQQRSPRTRFHFPIAIPISDTEISILNQGRETISNHRIITSYIIRHIQNADLQDQSTRESIISVLIPPIWTVNDFFQIVQRLSNNNNHCRIYPDICVFFYKLLDHRLGFLSDENIIQKHFGQQDYVPHKIRYKDGYPSRGRGWIVNQASEEKLPSLVGFMENYLISTIVQIDNSIFENIIPASIPASSSYRLKKNYSFLEELRDSFYILEL